MDKKKLTAWGVGFGSMALVAGMVGYLGITNKSATSNQAAATVQPQQANQSQEQNAGNNQSFTFNPSSNNSGGFDPSSGHHGNFDSTTGGS